MAMAEAIAQRSLCQGRKIGAVIVSPDNAYCVVGYNGPPRGFDVPWRIYQVEPSGCKAWCPRALSGDRTAGYANCVSVHAESNAIAKADRSRIESGTLYVTSACCWDCGKLVANSGIKKVVMRVDMVADEHRNPMKTVSFMRECGLEVVLWQ
jgi:deoxycytidylate deaminase